MGLEIGGDHNRPDWPKMGPSLLIATALIVAIRTARWPIRDDHQISNPELDEEIHYAARVAQWIMVHLMHTCETVFPQRKEPWYQANDEDIPQ
jgi:hypothetical protein